MLPDSAFFFYEHTAGLVIDGGPGSVDAGLTLQVKRPSTDPQAGQQLFTWTGSVITHVASSLVMDCGSGRVLLRAPVAGAAYQQWQRDDAGRVTSPFLPGQVLRATRYMPQQNNFYSPGAQIITAPDTAMYSGEGDVFRRFYLLRLQDRRAIYNLRGVVMGTAVPNLETYKGGPGQLWYPDSGMYINDSNGLALQARNLGGGRTYRMTALASVSSGSTFTYDENGPLIANPGSGTNLAYLYNAGTEQYEFWPPGTGGVDFRWCYGCGSDWIRLPGSFIDVSVGSDGIVVAVTPDNKMVYYAGGGRWMPVPGNPAGVLNVAVGNAVNIWYQDTRGGLNRFTGTSPAYWEPVTSPAARYITVTQTGTAWMIDTGGRIQRYSNAAWQVITAEWQSTVGHLDQISSTSDQDVWATGSDGRIWWYDPDAAAWEQVPGSLESVSSGGDGSAWGVNSRGMTYQYTGTEGAEWSQLPALLTQCSVGSAVYVWALGPGGAYRYDPHETDAVQLTATAVTGTAPQYAPTASDLDEAILCVNMSSISYQDAAAVPALLAPYGYALDAFFDNSATGTQGFLAHNDADKSVVLAFRGTSEMQDANIDLWQEQVPLSVPALGPDVKVVKGFDQAYTSIENEVMAAVDALMTPARLSAAQRFFVTGHSLGGGLATMSALQMAQIFLRKNRRGLVKCITFAAPAVGNPGFRGYYLSQTALFSAIAYTDQNDSVATGKWTVAPGVVLDLTAWGYVQPVPSFYIFDDDTPMPYCHLLDNYLRLLNAMAGRAQPIRQILVEITTGTNSVAPWWKFDTPGTSREVKITLGRPVAGTSAGSGGRLQQTLRPADDDWVHSGFETGQTTTFAVNNTLGLVQADLLQFTITIDTTSGGLINWDMDNWNLDGVKITADGVVRYSKKSLDKLLGPDYSESFTDSIPPPAP